jgi:hypothetical protein
MASHLKTRFFVNIILLIGNLTYGGDTVLTLWEDSSIFLKHLIVLDEHIIKSHQGPWTLETLERYLSEQAKLQEVEFFKYKFTYDELKYVPLPAILPTKDKRSSYVLLAVLEGDKQLRFQCIWGGRNPKLLNIADMRMLFGAEPIETWLFLKELPEGGIREIGDGAVKIDNLYHNFGFINWENLTWSLECSFNISNIGKTPLQVGYIQRSCQCTMANFEPNNIIQAGMASKLTIKRTPPGRRTLGFRDKIAIQIEDTDTKRKETIMFEILGNCDGQTIFPVPEEVNFGGIKPGGKGERIVRISESDAEKFSITEVKSNNPAFETGIDINHNDDSRDYIIHINFESAGLLPRNVNGKISIKTDHPRLAEFRIPVNAEILPQVRAIPSVLSWGLVKLGSSYKRSLQLTPIDEKNQFTIEKIDIPSDIRISKKELEDNTIIVEFSKVFDRPGNWQENATLHIRYLGNTNIIRIPLVGLVQ